MSAPARVRFEKIAKRCGETEAVRGEREVSDVPAAERDVAMVFHRTSRCIRT
jgi:hypothetical protein